MFATSIPLVADGDDAELHAEIRESIERLLADGSWANYQSPILAELRQEIAKQVGVEMVRLCASGSVAMELALRGCDLKPGDEVICPALDYPGNIRAVRLLDAIPVIVDSTTGRWTIDCDQLESACSSRTRAVIASHLYGEIANIGLLRLICDRNGWTLIEDACQMPGGRVDDQALGSFGHVAAFSFGGSKPLTSGCGGALVSDDSRIMHRIAAYADRPSDTVSLSPLQAAVLLPQWRRADVLIQRQQQSVRRLIELCQTTTTSWIWPDVSSSTSKSSHYKIPIEILPQLDQDVTTIQLRRSHVLELLERANISGGLPFRVVTKVLRGRGRMIGFDNAQHIAQKHFLLDHRNLVRYRDTDTNCDSAGPDVETSDPVATLSRLLLAIHDASLRS